MSQTFRDVTIGDDGSANVGTFNSHNTTTHVNNHYGEDSDASEQTKINANLDKLQREAASDAAFDSFR